MAVSHRSEAVIVKDNKVLLQKRSDVPLWALPGGCIEPNEKPYQAAVREVKEETGLSVQIKSYVGRYSSSYLRYHDETRVFLCTPTSSVITPEDSSEELRFFPVNSLPRTLIYLHKARILDAVKGKTDLNVKQSISFWKFLFNAGFNPVILAKHFVFSIRRII